MLVTGIINPRGPARLIKATGAVNGTPIAYMHSGPQVKVR